MNTKEYKEVSIEELNYLFNGSLIILLTATNIETKFTHKKLKPIEGYEKLIKTYNGDQTLYIGLLNKYIVAHVQCGKMGSISREGSIMTVSSALQRTNSKMVIMVGVAFGVDSLNQKIGDVLVSESIIPYDPKRTGKNKTISRGIESPSSTILLNRIRNIRTWEHFLNETEKAKIVFTRMLSGEELIDNIERRNQLCGEYPDSKGGEMEGSGIYAACNKKEDWIVIKGICDFADGNKGLNKSKRQEIAINSALSLCEELFSSEFAFSECAIQPYEIKHKAIKEEEVKLSEVLFDLYDISKEKFYVEKIDDIKFTRLIREFSVWIYGPSGVGKSNLILRNLIQKNLEFIQVNLAPTVGQDIESIFFEIYYEIVFKIKGPQSNYLPKSLNECLREIIKLLSDNYSNKELFIFIDEIPISKEEDYKAFTEKLVALIILKNSKHELFNLKFVLSSIENPKKHISEAQSKIFQSMEFTELNFWDTNEINTLIDRIESGIYFQVDSGIKKALVVDSNGSPRFIKKYYRSLCSLSKNDKKTSENLLKEIKREFR